MCLVLCFHLADGNCGLMREMHANIMCDSGLLLLSVADFGSPALVTTAISRPSDGRIALGPWVACAAMMIGFVMELTGWRPLI